MRIALLGGTGDIGKGLALRWAKETDHEIVIGSRDVDKAVRKAAEYRNTVAEKGADCIISGKSNQEACIEADIIVLSVPPTYITTTIETVAHSFDDNAIVVCPCVEMGRDESGFHYNQPGDAESYTAVAAAAVPDATSVVGAFHNISAKRLADLDARLQMDTLIVSDDLAATKTVADLAEEIDGLRAINAGPISNAKEVEAVTPLLINIAMQNEGMNHVGVQFE